MFAVDAGLAGGACHPAFGAGEQALEVLAFEALDQAFLGFFERQGVVGQQRVVRDRLRGVGG